MKTLYWGPMPWERDGGAVVSYYLLKMLNFLAPRDETWAVPKVPEELDSSYLPWVNFYSVRKNPMIEVPTLMLQNNIPLINLFHITREGFEKIINPIHDFGGKLVLHQTVHWRDDGVFDSKRLDDFDRIVTPTRWAKRVFKEVAKISPKKISVIPHGVDTNRFYPHETTMRENWGVPRTKKFILFTGRLNLWKGIHQLIPVMRKLINEFDCYFVIRGTAFADFEESKKLDYIFSTLSARNPNIIFIPEWQNPEFMEELFASCDILVSPTGHEGFNVPLVEAMATKMPIVTTALANHIEIMGSNGYTGLHIEPQVKVGEVNKGQSIKVPSPDQLYGALKYLLDNPEESELMGIRGLQRARKYYSLEKVARAWLKLYSFLIPDDYDMAVEVTKRLQL